MASTTPGNFWFRISARGKDRRTVSATVPNTKIRVCRTMPGMYWSCVSSRKLARPANPVNRPTASVLLNAPQMVLSSGNTTNSANTRTLGSSSR